MMHDVTGDKFAVGLGRGMYDEDIIRGAGGYSESNVDEEPEDDGIEEDKGDAGCD